MAGAPQGTLGTRPAARGGGGRGTPRGGRGRIPSLPNPEARHRLVASRDWRAPLNKGAARRGGAGALPRASRSCREPGRAGAESVGVMDGRGSGVCCPALGQTQLPKVGTSACGAITALLKHVTHCSGLFPESEGMLQIPRPVSGSEMLKDEEAEDLLPGGTEMQADTLGRTFLMRITLSHDCYCTW